MIFTGQDDCDNIIAQDRFYLDNLLIFSFSYILLLFDTISSMYLNIKCAV